MDYTKLFYWLTVADNAKSMFVTFIVLFMIIAVIATICYFCAITTTDGYGNGERTKSDDENQAMARKWMWWSYPFVILFWSLYVFTPSKKDALLIVAGGQTLNFLTTDESSKQIPKELSGFVLTELKNMAKEAQVDLGVKKTKEKILEEAKSMTAKEILEKAQIDTTFAKIVLEK